MIYMRALFLDESSISEHTSGFVQEQRKSACERRDSCSRILLMYFHATIMRSDICH